MAVILAVAAAALVFFWSQSREAPIVPAAPSQSQAPQDSEEDEPSITNYDECVAAGNSPLPDAPDKCLTKSGHVFIQGVVEE